MDNTIAQFIEDYDGADQIDYSDMDPFNDVELLDDTIEVPTSWETFCQEADAWARHAQASNGFGGF